MPKRPIQADDLTRIVYVGDPQISPDGQSLLFCKRVPNDKNKTIGHLFTVDSDGHEKQWTQGEVGAGGGRWSPCGTRILFVAGRDKPSAQFYLLPTDGGEARKLSSLPEGSIGSYKWSPDGKLVAFAFRETHPDWTEKAKKERDEKGLSTPPREIDHAWYRLDGDGYFCNQRHALYVLDVDTGEHRKVYEEPVTGMLSFDWAPCSTELAVSHTINKNPWADKPNDQIHRVSLDGQVWRLEGLPRGDKGSLAWSPCGKWIAYLGDVSEDDPWGVRNTKLYVVAAEGGAPRCLSDQDDYCLATATLGDVKEGAGDGAPIWSPDGQALYLAVGWHGASQLAFVPIAEGRVHLLTEGSHSISLGNLSADGERMGVLMGTATRLGEAGVYDLRKHQSNPELWTDCNRKWHDEVLIVEPEEHWVESMDGVKVHVWVIKPVGYLEPKRYPAVLEIHGGPHTQYGWSLFHEFQLLAAEGITVVYSNPRGSKGYGEAFCAAIKGDWGHKDWEDIQSVTRWMQHQPFIHPGQLGVMGGSYGGYMTNWVVGHTKDFKAAITDRCVSNLVSMAGSSDFPVNPDGYFGGGCAYGDHEAIRGLWKQSPLAYFDKVVTPMLIIHSEGDLRCNIEQSEQVFAALQLQGVESRFVRYPVNTSHGMSRNGPTDLRIHRLGEIVRWWRRHLLGGASA